MITSAILIGVAAIIALLGLVTAMRAGGASPGVLLFWDSTALLVLAAAGLGDGRALDAALIVALCAPAAILAFVKRLRLGSLHPPIGADSGGQRGG